MTLEEEDVNYYDTMDFNGFMSKSVNISITSVFNDEIMGLNQIKVFAKTRKYKIQSILMVLKVYVNRKIKYLIIITMFM